MRDRRVATPPQRLGWLIVLATIPVGISGLALEHLFRTTLGRPIPAAVFLTVNGFVLYTGERLRRRVAKQPKALAVPGGSSTGLTDSDLRIAQLPMRRGVLIGSAQIFALLPGISRSGVTMVAGLLRGLSHEDAALFSFLLATPVILAAGVLKIPEPVGLLGDGIGGQVLAGSLASFVAGLFSRARSHQVLRKSNADALRDLLRGDRTRQLGLADVALTSFGFRVYSAASLHVRAL